MADRMRESAGPGLLGLGMAAEAEQDAQLPLKDYLVPIVDDGRVELLHGIRDPQHGARLGPLWPRLAEALTAWDGDVIADLGQVGGKSTPVELLKAADAVVMVLKPTLAQVDAAKPRLEAVRSVVNEHATLGLCVINDGSYSAAELRRVLEVPVLAELPSSPADAQVLSDGARPRLTFRTSLLVRCLKILGRRLHSAVTDSAAPPTAPEDEVTRSASVAAGAPQ
ncbi:hypothetical protein [Actinomadura sp. 7K534]|uniref:hypothetical protein n=1 Tax=Actinomadura sp. 7K534 TaxID=2530366 RepID=UPI00104CE75C|nr:hypothetical protein [Actinomadura sp. 7K534]TDB96922.1 hypothetical protein E1266_08335 [Actinomadura sp. 7K534]